MKLLSSIVDNPVILVIILVAVFGVIVLAVILIKKYVPAFKNTDTLKSEKEIAEEEVNRLVVDVDEGLKKKEDKDKPSEEEALQYEMNRILEDIPEEKKKDEGSKEKPSNEEKIVLTNETKEEIEKDKEIETK